MISTTNSATIYTMGEISRKISLFSNPHPEAIRILKANRLFEPSWQQVFAILRNPNPESIDLIDVDELYRKFPKSKGSLPNWAEFWTLMSAHPNSLHILRENKEKINWLSAGSNSNPEFATLFSENPEKIKDAATTLSANPWGLRLMLGDSEKKWIQWSGVCANHAELARDLLRQNPKKMDFGALSTNNAPWAIELLQSNRDKIDYYALARNNCDEAVALLSEWMEKDASRINDPKIWRYLSANSSPLAVNMLCSNTRKISWGDIMVNTSLAAMQLLAEKLEELEDVSWGNLGMNPAIFETVVIMDAKPQDIANNADIVDIIFEPIIAPKCVVTECFKEEIIDWEDENYMPNLKL